MTPTAHESYRVLVVVVVVRRSVRSCGERKLGRGEEGSSGEDVMIK
jgi:hypothetical protein